MIITDGRGRVITSAEDVPLTRDGGVDVTVTARPALPDRVQKAVETRIRKIMEGEDFASG